MKEEETASPTAPSTKDEPFLDVGLDVGLEQTRVQSVAKVKAIDKSDVHRICSGQVRWSCGFGGDAHRLS